eukprot:569153-Pyramimonas_sp.AAC.2
MAETDSLRRLSAQLPALLTTAFALLNDLFCILSEIRLHGRVGDRARGLPISEARHSHFNVKVSHGGQGRPHAVRFDFSSEGRAVGELLVTPAKHSFLQRRLWATTHQVQVQGVVVNGLGARRAARSPVQLGVAVDADDVHPVSAGPPRAEAALLHERAVPGCATLQEALQRQFQQRACQGSASALALQRSLPHLVPHPCGFQRLLQSLRGDFWFQRPQDLGLSKEGRPVRVQTAGPPLRPLIMHAERLVEHEDL